MLSYQAKQFFIAFRQLSFLSRWYPLSEGPEQIGRAAMYLPVAGFALGLGPVVFYYLLSRLLASDLVCLLVLLMMFIFSGGQQVRACLAILGGTLRARAGPNRSVDEDLRMDVLGMTVLVFLIVLKFLALSHIGAGWVLKMLVILPMISGWTWVYLSHSWSASSALGGAAYIGHVRTLEFWVATFFTTLVIISFLGLLGLFLLMFISLWTAIVERYVAVRQEKNFETVCKATMEMNEVLLLVIAIMLRKVISLVPGGGELI